MTLEHDGGVSSSWGGIGKWKIASPHHVSIYWMNKVRFELEYDANLKTFVVDGKARPGTGKQ